jgi:hypothetical protein
MQRFWYASDTLRERFVSICSDKDCSESANVMRPVRGKKKSYRISDLVGESKGACGVGWFWAPGGTSFGPVDGVLP